MVPIYTVAVILQSLLVILLCRISAAAGPVSENKLLEGDLMKHYDKRHRPVKKDSTMMNVQVFLMINHIERVDEKEQTMLLHGVLWAMWEDEYLTWNPADYNGTAFVSIESWKLWQPTFALYNSARSNGWFVYMNGMPATVSNGGRVIGTGTFSFFVTCLFEFSNYPYDVQECPIVLADWMYDLSKINLSESVGNPAINPKPVVRLSYDILNGSPKNHVAGWEMLDTWQKHCYWGPKGCTYEMPFFFALDNYWSLLEFGVKIRRHAPYYGLTMVLPTIITASITLLAFWVEDLTLAAVLCVLNVLLQAFAGADLMSQLPPGNGAVPKIVKIYALNLTLTVAAYLTHALIQYAINVLPPDSKLPIHVQNISAKLKCLRFFKLRGVEVDPKTLSFSPTDLSFGEMEHHAPGALRYIDAVVDAPPAGGALIVNVDVERGASPPVANASPPMVELDLGGDNNGNRSVLIAAEQASEAVEIGSARNWLDKIKAAVKSEPPVRQIGGGGVFNAIFDNIEPASKSVQCPEPKANGQKEDSVTHSMTRTVITPTIVAPMTHLRHGDDKCALHNDLHILRRLIFTVFFVIVIAVLPFLLF